MKICLYLFFLIFLSCGGGISNYSEEISGGYIYSNQGEGANGIYGGSEKVPPIEWIKKYDDDGKYISIWQADTVLMQSPKFNYGYHKKNTYYPNDRFYIIDIKNEKLLGPYKKDEFFKKARELKISVHWKPVVVEG